jgi:hypothetical protein
VTGDPGLDSLAVTAALAALTYRSLLVTALPAAVDDRTLGTVARLSRGRLALYGDRTRLAGIPDIERFYPLVREPDADLVREADAVLVREPDPALVRESDGVFVRETEGEPERWERTAWSGGRAAWRTAVAEAAERGAAGLLVPAGPPLRDLLRNPGDSGDRRDLQLAQG